MATATLQGIHPSIRDVVGTAVYVRGLQHAGRHTVAQVRWSPDKTALHGSVFDSRTKPYATTASFAPGATSPEDFRHGTCTCPVGFNCKHVVALVVATLGAGRPGGSASATPRLAPWEASLGSLLGGSTGPAARTSGTPLAIELALVQGAPPAPVRVAAPPTFKLLARLVMPGAKGWIRGSLSWTMLDTSYRYSDHPASHTNLLRELYSLYRSRSSRPGHTSGYYYGEEKAIDLAGFESRHLWQILDEAAAVDLRLVHATKRLGPLEAYRNAELQLDATRPHPAGSLVVAPVLRLDGGVADAEPLCFLGTSGHGVVYGIRGESGAGGHLADRRIRLARLGRGIPPDLQRMALEDRRIEVPPAGEARFRDEYCLRLRRLAPVVSTDGSFEAPAVSAPTLVLAANYGDGHGLDLVWEWAYEVGDSTVRAPLAPDPGDPGYRDPAQERALLAGLELPSGWSGLLHDPGEAEPGQAAAAHLHLDGIETMQFTTEVLPLLTGRPDLTVELAGAPVDYREAGDSLRVGVSTGAVDGSTDWYDLGVTVTLDGRQVPFAEMFLALSRGESHMLLDDGAYFSLDKPQLQALRDLIEEARTLQDSPGGPLRISRFQTGLWDELVELGVVEHQAKAWQQQVDAMRAVDGVGSLEPPPTLTAALRPYQLDGFRWLAFLWKFRLGGILADDMGLGKTLQTLALICHAKEADPTGPPFLIIAPTSVVSNWASESARFAPGLKIAAISDTVRRRGGTLDEAVEGADVVITSYTLFRLDFADYSRLPWAALVLDEAQFTKNHQSKVHQCARALPAPIKLAITGTPMENNLMELWSLLSITAPGLFPSPTRFRDYYVRPIEGKGDPELLAQLRRRIKPLIKRRTKEQVAADLPAKQEQVLEVELHPRHRKIYQTHLQRERQKVLGLVDDMNKNRFTIFRSLTLLRRLSLHAGLIDGAHLDVPSAKLDALFDQLTDVIDGGHRALVFSQFTGFLGQVRARLDVEGVEYCYLDGSTRNRPAVLKRFKEGAAPVFLISLKAGGCGLNLPEADYCFLLDPWWNPATEAQAVDRAHRIGQTRNVMVYRLIAKDTIEEKVMALKARKAELFSGLMDEGNAFGTSLDAEDIRGLFG